IANFLTSTLILAQDNVLRSQSTAQRPIGGSVLFGPDSVVLHHATGGFNCVIEVSSKACQRKLGDQVSGVYALPTDSRSLEQLLIVNANNLHSAALKRVATQPALLQTKVLVLSVDLVALAFDAPKNVVL